MSTTDHEADILRIFREITYAIDSLPTKVADRVADRLKDITLPLTPGPNPENVVAANLGTTDSSPELESAWAELAEITKERDKAQSDLNELIEKLRQSEQQLIGIKQNILTVEAEELRIIGQKNQIELEITRLHKELESAHAELEQISDSRAKLATLTNQAQGLIAEAEHIQRNKELAERMLSENEEQRAKFEAYQQAGENARKLMERFWPAWLRNGSLSDWRQRIETGILDPASPPTLGLVFAALHTFNAALLDSEPKTLHDSLRDVGRRLYAWLRDLGQSDAEAGNVAGLWAQAINGDCAGRGEIEVPIPGNAANNQWMIFQPRGGHSPDVMSVRSWCVRDAQKRPVHRAEVIV